MKESLTFRNLERRKRQTSKSLFLPHDSTDEHLKRLVRRAVNNTEVPADLSAKVLKSLREQSFGDLK